jgi:hypothetical protein
MLKSNPAAQLYICFVNRYIVLIRHVAKLYIEVCLRQMVMFVLSGLLMII